MPKHQKPKEKKTQERLMMNTRNLTRSSVAEVNESMLKVLYSTFVKSVAHLAVAVLNDHEHRGVLPLHGSVQRLNAHAML